MYQFYLSILSSRVSAPTLKYWHHPFLPTQPLKKILNLSDLFLWATTPQNFGELDSPFEMSSRPKKQHSFFKETKDFISNIKKDIFQCWNLNIQLQNLKIKGDFRVL